MVIRIGSIFEYNTGYYEYLYKFKDDHFYLITTAATKPSDTFDSIYNYNLVTSIFVE